MAKVIFLLFLCTAYCKENLPCFEIKQSAGACIEIPAHESPITEKSLKKFAEIGIKLVFSAPISPPKQNYVPINWERGTLFLEAFNQKGDLFRKWLECAKIYPSNLYLIDSDPNHD